MRRTRIAVLCDCCNGEFELFSADGADDSTVVWNYCPFCGAKKEIWLRFMRKNENLDIGINYEIAKIRFPFQRKR